jgi:hypothetical protein
MGVFIAVAVILVLMNALFFYLLKGAAKRLGKFSKMNMLHEANVYDDLLENKELELKALLAKIEKERARLAEAEAAAAAPGAGSAARQGTANVFALMRGRYMDKDFTSGYQTLRNRFEVDKAAAVEEVRRAEKKPVPRGGAAAAAAEANAASELLESVDLDTRYRLALLERDKAFGIMLASVMGTTAASAAKRVLVENYIRNESGDIVDFFNWLEYRAFTDSAELVVRTGNPDEDALAYGRGVVTQYDPDVCEGVYVIAGGRMHDFSIKSREIGG